MPGSVYRLVPKRGQPFVGTVVSRGAIQKAHRRQIQAFRRYAEKA